MLERFRHLPGWCGNWQARSDANYDAVMRTTIDLPDDVHRAALNLARDRGQTLSRTVAELVRRGLADRPAVPTSIDEQTGLMLIHLGHRVTAEDVAAASDDE